MNNPNPFHPQSSFLLEQKDKARARLKIAVFSGLSLSVVALMALLIQGCRKPAEPTAENQPDTNAPQAFEAPTNTMPDTNVIPTNTPPPPPIVEPTPTVLPPVAAGSEYTIVKGDTFATIAKAHGVSSKAIQDANPGVDPKKLKIGQKIQIPGATSAPAAVQPVAPAATTPDVSANGMTSYKVKSGDTLTKIAKQFGTTVKAIESANNLSTTSIKVGQVLKIPTKASAPAAPAPTPGPAPVPMTSPAPAPAPAGNTTT